MELLRKLSGLLLFIVFCNSMQAQDEITTLIDAFTQSYTYEKNADYTKAIEVLKKVYNTNSYEINLRLGWLNYQAGLFTEAIANYQKAIELRPMAIEARLGLVYPASAMGNWKMVTTQYEKILEIDPNNSVVNYRIGLIYYGKENYQTAFNYFSKVVNLYPFSYDALIMLAWTNLKLNKLSDAKILFNKVLMLSPNDASAIEGLSLIK